MRTIEEIRKGMLDNVGELLNAIAFERSNNPQYIKMKERVFEIIDELPALIVDHGNDGQLAMLDTIAQLRTRIEELEAQRDKYKDAIEKSQEHFSDAWALSVDYDGFGGSDDLKGLIDDIVMNMGLGRKILHAALVGK
jgi:hypothetical protein